MNRYVLISGIMGPVTTLLLILIDILLSGSFSWHTDIPGITEIQNSYLFDSAVIFWSIMNIIFAISLYKVYPIKFLSIGFIIAGSICLLFMGIFNGNYGMHLIFELTYFIILPLGIIIFSIFRINKYINIYGYTSGILSLAAIISGIFINFYYADVKIGLPATETIEAILLGSWSVVTGSYTIKNYTSLKWKLYNI